MNRLIGVIRAFEVLVSGTSWERYSLRVVQGSNAYQKDKRQKYTFGDRVKSFMPAMFD
jgi:hypothetical protein